MEQAKRTALERAILLLNAAGVQYAIVTPDGETFGELPIAKPVTETKYKKTGVNYKAAWGPVVDTIQPGELVAVAVPEGGTLVGLHGALAAAAVHHFGKGNAITSRNRETGCIELLRVA
jgi:hypothetical protein